MTTQETKTTTAQNAPVVVEVKKKKKYSKNLKDLQKSRESGAKAMFKIANAVAVGIDRYRSESDKSARKKKDGALRDYIPNIAEGMGKTLRVGSKASGDIGKMWNTKRRRKRTKRFLRNISQIRIWR